MEADITQRSLSQAISDSNKTAKRKLTDFQEIMLSFFGGCIGGVANVLTGHPLDTIKVRMQMNQVGFISSCKALIKQEGARSLFKGVGSPLYSVPFVYALYFGAYELAKTLQGIGHDDKLTFKQSLIAGAFSGVPATFLITPVELVKCNLQMEGMGTKTTSMTPLMLAKKIYKTEGIAGLYKGNLVTLVREVFAGIGFFVTYDMLKDEVDSFFGPSLFNPFITGGIAGFVCQLISYPQDVVKTMIQCDIAGKRIYEQHPFWRDGGIISCTKELYKAHGMMGFWRGLSAGVTRGVITEAVTLLVYIHGKKVVN